MWTAADGIKDLDPTGLDDSAGRFVTEDGSLIIGQIFARTGWRIFAWTQTTGLVDIGTLGRDMLPEYMNRQGALTGTVQREDGTEGTFFWSQTNGLEDIGSLGGDEIRPTAINDSGAIAGFGTTASGETHGFVWSKVNGLVDIGTLGGDFSWASDINSSGLVAGYSKTPSGDEHAIAWSADGGMIDLGTLGGSQSRGQFVTEAGAIIGVSGVKGHRTHAFVWTEAGGMVEMPSLGRFERVDAASRTGAFTSYDRGRSRCTRCCGRRYPPLHATGVSHSRHAGGQVCEPHSSPPVFSGSFSWQAFRPSGTRLRRSPGATPIFRLLDGHGPRRRRRRAAQSHLRTDGTWQLAARDTLLHLCGGWIAALPASMTARSGS
jgi:probable HAF family extracellular repeat protein